MERFDGVVFDVDGTLLRGTAAIPGAPAAVQRVRDAGASVVFVTNNPTRTPGSYVEKLAEAGIQASVDEVVTSGTTTAAFLQRNYHGEPAFVVGEDGLVSQVADAGIDVREDPTRARGVVASIDRGFTYDQLTDALRAFETDVDWFVGTDPDRTIPTTDGLVPGSGAIVESIAAVAERRPDVVLGKPHAFTRALVFERLGCDPGDVLVVGDRLDTDVAFGRRAGATTVLVQTGIDDYERPPPGDPESDRREADVVPDHVCSDVTSIFDR